MSENQWPSGENGAPPPPPPPDGAAAGPAATAEGYGGLGKRFGARIIDAVIVGVLLGLVVGLGLGLEPTGLAYGVLASVANLAYFVGMESSRGATLGKRLLGMAVTDEAGGRVSVEQSLRRNWWVLLGLVPVIGGLAGFAVAIYIAVTLTGDERNQGFHDKMAHTLVVES